MTKSQHQRLHVGLIIILFIGQFLIVDPRGEFSTNDDWVHADTIKHWVDTSEFRLMPFAGPSFYVPILYGAALVRSFGFSFEILRASTLILTLLSLLFFYYLLIRLETRPSVALLGTILLWVNPIFYNLSLSFMTDIPAMFFLILSLLSYTIGWQRQQLFWFAVGSLAVLAGAFTRQIYIVPIFALALTGFSLPQPLRQRVYIGAIMLPLALAFGLYAYLDTAGMAPESLGVHFYANVLELTYHALEWLWYQWVYAGLLTLPLLMLFPIRSLDQRLLAGVGLVAGAIAAIFAIDRSAFFPYIGNTINLNGLGPNTDLVQGNMRALLPPVLWIIITGLAVYGSALLATIMFAMRSSITHQGPSRLFFVLTLLFAGPFLIVTGFDRYLLPLFALTILLIAPHLLPVSPRTHVVGWFFIGIVGVYSLTQTAHHLNWNRARWQLAESVLENGVPINDIDAGFEWDGWHGYWSAQTSGIPGGPGTSPWWIQKLMTNNTEQFVVSFSPLPGYTVIDQRPVTGLNPNHTIYLNKK